MKILPSTFYIAGRLGKAEEAVRDLVGFFEDKGCRCNYDWTKAEGVKKPYLDHVEINRPIAHDMIHAASVASVFVLLVGSDIYMAMVEFGVALASRGSNLFQKIQVVVPKDGRQSLSFCHENVQIFQSIDELKIWWENELDGIRV